MLHHYTRACQVDRLLPRLATDWPGNWLAELFLQQKEQLAYLLTALPRPLAGLGEEEGQERERENEKNGRGRMERGARGCTALKILLKSPKQLFLKLNIHLTIDT